VIDELPLSHDLFHRKLSKSKGAFPNEESLLKLLYMGIENAQKKWSKAIWLYLNLPFATKAGWIAIWSYDLIMLYFGMIQKTEQSRSGVDNLYLFYCFSIAGLRKYKMDSTLKNFC
jgi:hypothetical protein